MRWNAGAPGEETVTVRTASCSCGRLTAVASGEPVRVSICHCLACQRRTGSVFGAQARFPKAAVAVRGEWTTWVREADDGDRIAFHFCPACGATVFYEIESLEGFVALPAGAFADPAFPPPTVSVYEERMHPWVGLPPEMEHIG